MGNKSDAYAFQLADNQKLKNSASGGFFSALCEYVIKNGGVVFGAVYSDDFSVVHVGIDSIDQCEKFSGSKYVQSNLGDTFKQVKELLDQGCLVCYSGVGCQIAGLNCFLGKEYQNLITVDLVCAGVPSPKLWSNYIDYQEGKYKSKLEYVNFRNKTYGYQSSTMLLTFDNGKIYSHSGRIDPMVNFFVSGIAKRPSCYECRIKGVKRKSDFTIFDSWHAAELIGEDVDDRGYTNIIPQSLKARKLLQEITVGCVLRPIDIDKAVALDGKMFMQLPNKNNKRNEFYKTLELDGFEGCVRKYLKITFTDKVLENIKPMLYRTGLISKVKQIKRLVK